MKMHVTILAVLSLLLPCLADDTAKQNAANAPQPFRFVGIPVPCNLATVAEIFKTSPRQILKSSRPVVDKLNGPFRLNDFGDVVWRPPVVTQEDVPVFLEIYFYTNTDRLACIRAAFPQTSTRAVEIARDAEWQAHKPAVRATNTPPVDATPEKTRVLSRKVATALDTSGRLGFVAYFDRVWLFDEAIVCQGKFGDLLITSNSALEERQLRDARREKTGREQEERAEDKIRQLFKR